MRNDTGSRSSPASSSSPAPSPVRRRARDPALQLAGHDRAVQIHDHGMHFKLKAKRPIDVAVVGARLDPSGETGWHMHPAKSLVTVQPGAART